MAPSTSAVIRLTLNPLCQATRVCPPGTSRTPSWASSSRRSIPWPTASTTCRCVMSCHVMSCHVMFVCHLQVHLCGNTSAGVCSNMTPFNGKLYKVRRRIIHCKLRRQMSAHLLSYLTLFTPLLNILRVYEMKSELDTASG